MTMTAAEFLAVDEQAPAKVERDRWQRPMIAQPDGSKKPYTRASTLGKALDDEAGLTAWKMRLTAIGIARRKDLIIAVNAHFADKTVMSGLVDQAMDAAEAGAAATAGTALHELMDAYDHGRTPYVPDEYRGDIEAYRAVTAGLEFVRSETFVVDDELEVAGTYDNLWRTKGYMITPDGSLLAPGSLLIGDKKGLALTTPLPTPTGWTTMGAVEVGDQVIGSDGLPCMVTEKSKVKRIGTYIVTFDDGSQVTCDSEHIWWVNGGGHGAAHKRTRPVGIKEIIDNFRSPQGQCWWRVPMPDPVRLWDADLEIDPYLLGCWLGDGHHQRQVITKGRDLFEILEADGHELGVEQRNHSDQVFTRTVHGLIDGLRHYDLLGNKHIPPQYLRASLYQRQQLLRGLMDTDGSWNTARGRAVFTTTDKALALQVEELLLTLGQRPHVATVPAKGFGVETTAYHVEFLPVDLAPFRLPRKAAKVTTDVPTTRSRRRLMVSIEPGPDVETACIAVNSPNHTYLCGERMVPTHNTGAEIRYGHGSWAVQLSCYAHGLRYDPATDSRLEPEPICRDWGLVVHAPVMKGTATLYWIDLRKGRQLAHLATQVRAERKAKTMRPANLTPMWPEIADAAGSLAELRAVWSSAADAGALDADLKAHLTARSKTLAG